MSCSRRFTSARLASKPSAASGTTAPASRRSGASTSAASFGSILTYGKSPCLCSRVVLSSWRTRSAEPRSTTKAAVPSCASKPCHVSCAPMSPSAGCCAFRWRSRGVWKGFGRWAPGRSAGGSSSSETAKEGAAPPSAEGSALRQLENERAMSTVPQMAAASSHPCRRRGPRTTTAASFSQSQSGCALRKVASRAGVGRQPTGVPPPHRSSIRSCSAARAARSSRFLWLPSSASSSSSSSSSSSPPSPPPPTAVACFRASMT
mmetsp:Transcript_4656/g.15527  ORF Transcript_4656/g.15527 Transcript_4656/m.15527 type:complete len:262 (+) Transcript_4656:1038-1823(+)